MFNKGKDKKLIKAISELRPMEKVSGSPELMDVHSRLLKGRTSFERVITGSMASAMSISNLDLQVSDRVEELTEISSSLSDTAHELSDISAETANVTKEVAVAHDLPHRNRNRSHETADPPFGDLQDRKPLLRFLPPSSASDRTLPTQSFRRLTPHPWKRTFYPHGIGQRFPRSQVRTAYWEIPRSYRPDKQP